MCRITGFRDFQHNVSYDLSMVNTDMRDILSYGGPDDQGSYIDLNCRLALGHRRLSILELSPLGHQPMTFENLTIIYNGEVYNFEEIRKRLEVLGYVFTSNSDTEVVLKAFHKWGMDSIHEFRGMWAFVVWDAHKKQLILCRDRVGVKPLYWYYNKGLFMFASELKAFHKHPRFQNEIDMAALSLYFQYGYITSPFTIFRNAYKLEPGSFLKVDKDGTITKMQYWSPEKHFETANKNRTDQLLGSEDEIAEELEGILTESFKLRMIADVPVGLFLSGGVDSSLVAALLQKEYSKPLKTFTIGFHEKAFNEAGWARDVARHLGTDHMEVYCTPKDALEVIPRLPDLYDEPFGDSSAIPTFLVSQLAKQYVKVALSADAGDELFCGYTKYWILGDRLKRINKLPFNPVLSGLLDFITPDFANHIYERFKFVLPQWSNFRDKYIKLRNVLKVKDEVAQIDAADKFFLPEELIDLGLKEIINQTSKFPAINLDIMTKFMLFDIKTYMADDILVKVDRATMGVSLEGREPFLDKAILEYSAQLPIQFKYKNGISKYILRKILHKYVPHNLIERRKHGFGIPLYDWLRNDMRNLFAEYLNTERIKREGIFRPEAVRRLQESRGISAQKLWFLLMFQMWHEKWAA